MKSGDLVPDTMILRLILNELNKRGWVKKGPVVPYTLHYAAEDAALEQGADEAPVMPTLPAESFQYSDAPNASFILDGFPRNASQAAQIDKIVPINLVVNINTPKEIILDRICNRWVHGPSGRVYNTTFNAPKVEGKDDVSGEPLTRRPDDEPEVWKSRLANHEKTSLPLLEHYDKKGVLWTVHGNSSNEISPKLFAEFERRFCGD
jgi:adenylate kinase